jgi:hypothetical protein
VTCSFHFSMRLYIGIMSISRELRDHHERRPSQYTVSSNVHIEVVVALIDTEIIGALLGASVATFAGAAVSRWSIRYDRRLAACSAMQTLADEARFNAHVGRNIRQDLFDYSPSAPNGRRLTQRCRSCTFCRRT